MDKNYFKDLKESPDGTALWKHSNKLEWKTYNIRDTDSLDYTLRLIFYTYN